MIKTGYIKIAAAIFCLFFSACSNNAINVYHEGNRDNVIDGTALMVSIDDNLPPIHTFAVPILAGDTLIIFDFKSTELLCTAYDIYNDTTIGRFGKFGGGPGEIGNPLFPFYNKYNKSLYIGNGHRGKISRLYLPKAVRDSTYDAIDQLPMDFTKGILYPYAINESTILCTTYPDLSTRVSRISTLNLVSGEINVIDSVFSDEKVRTAIAISEKDNLIFSADKQHDLIRILDLDCKLRGIVYGPEYSDKINEYEYYFSVSEICGNIVASLYTERDMKKFDTTIILTDLEGKYLKTLRFDETIYGMQYHNKTGRLYLTTTGEPQIGYIELDKIPD